MTFSQQFPATVLGDAQTRFDYIKTAAYYISLKNPNMSEVQCWLEGERQIDNQYCFFSHSTMKIRPYPYHADIRAYLANYKMMQQAHTFDDAEWDSEPNLLHF